jgi:hypothetical protein
MGLFSSIKKGLSKAWKGVKKAVKGVAKGVKKVAKGIVTSLPGGQKLWKAGGKLGKKVMGAIGKFTSKLGPIGTMALSFVLAPVMGPAIGAMWGSFGAGAASMAASANAFVSTLGSVGSGIFAAGNFVGGTLGALGNAITEGASNVLAGNFSGAAQAFASNVTNAFTGKAGMAAVHTGSIMANTTAAADLAGQVGGSGAAGQINTLTETANASLQSLQGMGQVGADAIAAMDPQALARASNEAFTVQQSVQDQMAAKAASSPVLEGVVTDPMAKFNPAAKFGPAPMSGMEAGAAPTFGEALQMTTAAGPVNANIARNTIANVTAGNTTFQALNQTAVSDGASKAMQNYDAVKGLLGGDAGDGGFQPYVPQLTKAQPISAVSGASGQGSAGFSLLSGVQGLEESLRRSQQLMFS